MLLENNPKYANRIIKQLKAFAKANNLDKSYDPYKAAYGSMPTHAASNQAIHQRSLLLSRSETPDKISRSPEESGERKRMFSRLHNLQKEISHFVAHADSDSFLYGRMLY